MINYCMGSAEVSHLVVTKNAICRQLPKMSYLVYWNENLSEQIKPSFQTNDFRSLVILENDFSVLSISTFVSE